MQELTEAGVRWEEKDEIIKWNRTDKVQQEPCPHIAASDLVRLKYDLIGEVVGYDTCVTQMKQLL